MFAVFFLKTNVAAEFYVWSACLDCILIILDILIGKSIEPNIVLVIDNNIFKEMNQSLDDIHKYCTDIVKIMNSVSR